MYLLDTNHCSRLIDGDSALSRRLVMLDDAPVLTTTVAVGELVYMAHRSDRMVESLEKVEAFIGGLPVLGIDSSIARTYGGIRAALFRRFGPKERAKQRHTTMTQLGFDDNDLWVAAIAIHHDLVVVTSDGDFDRIAEVVPLRHESWLEPALAAE